MDTLIQTLIEIASRYGTPTYAYDIRRLNAQVAKLRDGLPREVDILYSLKANASLGVCDVFAAAGIGADVASAGELAIAVQAGFPADRIFVAGPFKSAETITQLCALESAIVSVDSPSELGMLADRSLTNRMVLRLRPDFNSAAAVAAGPESRFGFTSDDLLQCEPMIRSMAGEVVGFHVFAGSQVLDAPRVIEHLQLGFDLARRVADRIGIEPTVFNLGGGFGIPYAPDEPELDLGAIGDALGRLVDRAAPGRIVLELGRYLVAQAGWYLTRVLGRQSYQGRPAVIVDGGTHQRADMCGLCLRSKSRPEALEVADAHRTPTDVLGCLSLPADVLAERAILPPVEAGNVLAFPNAGAYGLWSSPALFHGSPLPAEVAFDGLSIQLMRARLPARSILDGQQHVQCEGQPQQSVSHCGSWSSSTVKL